MSFTKIGTWLPVFPGFYGTIFEYPDDMEWELFNNSDEIIDELKDFACGIVWDVTDNDKYSQDVSKACTEFMECRLKQLFPNIIKSVKFEALRSPRFYNFTNDAIDIIIEVDFNALLKRFIKSPLAVEYLKSTYTSYDGFWSSYPNNIKEWVGIAWEKNAHTTASMLQLFCTGERLEMEMYEYVSESVYLGEYVDYDKLAKLCNEGLDLVSVLTGWDQEQLEDAQVVKRGTKFMQRLTGKGLYETPPTEMLESDFIDDSGLNKT